MKKPRFILLVVSVVALIVALAADWLNSRYRGVPSQSVHPPLAPVHRSEGSEHRTVESDAKPQGLESKGGVRRPASPLTEAERILQQLDTMEPILPGEVESEAAVELLRQWATIDPQAALEYAARLPALHGRADLPVELFRSWRNADESAALQWFDGLPEGWLRSDLVPAVISALAGKHPDQALQLASTLTGEARKRALAAFFSEWAASDPVTAVMQARQLADEEEQALALRQAISKWADRDLSSAIQWVRRLPHQYDPGTLDLDLGVLEALLDPWAAKSPKDAAGYLLSNREITRRVPMLAAVARQWAGQNPNEALQWAASVGEEADRSLMVKSVLATVGKSDLEAAANLALSIPPGTSQQQGMAMIFDQWMAANPTAIPAWATSLVNNSIQPEVLNSVVSAWAGSSIQSLGQWLNTLPAGLGRDACCAALARYLAATQPQVAAEWANAIANPRLRQENLKNIRTQKR